MKRTIHVLPFVAIAASLLLWWQAGPLVQIWEYSATTLWSWISLHDKPPLPETRYLGIYRPEAPYSVDGIEALSEKSGVCFHIISLYQAWGRDSVSLFPLAELDAINRYDAIPMVTWEPWLSGFAGPRETRAGREARSLRRISRGEFDAYIRQWARDAFEWGKPMFLRFAHEMDNAEQYPWTAREGNAPGDFIKAWKHVRKIFDDEGAHNIAWVWSPRDAGAERFWPGEDAVDWTSVTVFNYGGYHNASWMPFSQIFAPKYGMLKKFNKPMMIGETGCVVYGGDQAEWFDTAWSDIGKKFPNVRAIVLFQHSADKTSGALIDWSFVHVPASVEALQRAVKKNILAARP